MSYYQPLSYWELDTYFNDCDVAIVGGGIVGMNAALRIKEINPKCKITILERSTVGTAASSRNAGFACYGSPSEILSDLGLMSESAVSELISRRVEGLTLLRDTIGNDALRYSRTGGHEVFLDTVQLELHLDQLDLINRLVSQINPSLKFYHSRDNRSVEGVSGIISNDWEGQIHPGYMMNALRRKCQSLGIYVLSNFEVSNIERKGNYKITGNSISINASKVIICNNAFAKDLVDLETMAGRNQVLLTAPIKNLPIHGCYHYDRGYVYFRNVGERVLIGGGRNIDPVKESTDRFGETETIRTYLLKILDTHILVNNEYKIDHEWSGILGFNETKQPIIKEVESEKFVAVGLGGMGVAIGSLVGKEVADLLLQS